MKFKCFFLGHNYFSTHNEWIDYPKDIAPTDNVTGTCYKQMLWSFACLECNKNYQLIRNFFKNNE